MNRRRGRIALTALAMFVWIVAPIAAVGIMTWQLAQVELSPKQPVWVAATPSEESVTSEQALILTWAPAQPLLAPDWDGVVQRVLVEPGVTIESGQPVVQVSGVKRLAIASSIPFARLLDVGDQGEDVQEFNSIARSLGFRAPEGPKFTQTSGMAAAALFKSLGGQAGPGPLAFDPAWFIFLPRPTVAEAVSFTVGAPAPAKGEEVVTGRASLASAQIVSPAVLDSANAKEKYDPAVDLDASDLERLAPGNQLQVGETLLEVEGDQTTVAQTDLAILSSLVQPGARGVRGQVIAPTTEGQWLIPSAAVVVDSNGSSCVLVKTTKGSDPREAVVTAQSRSSVVVTADIQLGDRVAVSPPASERTCE